MMNRCWLTVSVGSVMLFGMLLITGCALNPMRISRLEKKVNSDYAQLNEDLARANAKISELESALAQANSKIGSLESQLNANQQEAYLKVMVPILNIRTYPTTTDNNVIAKAEEGAYVRKIATVGEDNKWFKVEFMVDDYPYIGYVYNNPEFFQEELYDPMTFSRVYNRKLIKYVWETEAAMEMVDKDYKTLGVYIKTDDANRKDRFLSYLAKKFREHKIYIKPIDVFNMSQITRQCAKNNVQGILSIEIESTTEASPLMDVKLFDKSNIILYSALVPLQAIELTHNLGRR